MSFSGKKFRRIRCENIEGLVKTRSITDKELRMLKCHVPVFCFTRIDEHTFNYHLQFADQSLTYTFRLGEETEMEKRDGLKIKVTYKLEGDDVLHQVTKFSDGKVVHFRREFGKDETKMTVSIEGTNVKANIYYEVVE